MSLDSFDYDCSIWDDLHRTITSPESKGSELEGAWLHHKSTPHQRFMPREGASIGINKSQVGFQSITCLKESPHTCWRVQIWKNTARVGRGEQEGSGSQRPHKKKLPWSRGSSIHPLEIVRHSSPPGLQRSPDLCCWNHQFTFPPSQGPSILYYSF